MMFKQLIENEAQFLDFAWDFLKFMVSDVDVYSAEDLKILQPFFDFWESRPDRKMTEEEILGSEHYIRTQDFYEKAEDKKKAIQSLGIEKMAYNLGVLLPEENDEVFEDDWSFVTRDTIQKDPEVYVGSYPLVLVGQIGIDEDARHGDVVTFFMASVNLKDFENAK